MKQLQAFIQHFLKPGVLGPVQLTGSMTKIHWIHPTARSFHASRSSRSSAKYSPKKHLSMGRSGFPPLRVLDLHETLDFSSRENHVFGPMPPPQATNPSRRVRPLLLVHRSITSNPGECDYVQFPAFPPCVKTGFVSSVCSPRKTLTG